MKSREQKRQECQARTEKFQALTPQQKLDHLDALLGKGLGARKQRAKLIALLPPPPVIEEPKKEQPKIAEIKKGYVRPGTKILIR